MAKRKSKLPSVIILLKDWRKTNRLSQRQACTVMANNGVPVILSTLQKWEIGERSPGKFAHAALDQFMRLHPVITDPPVFGRWKHHLPDSKVAEIRKLREGGATLLTLAEKFRISESSVSRICRGTRRAITS